MPRCPGALALAGTARVAGGRMEFELRALARPGAFLMAIRGALANGRLEVAEALTSVSREPHKKPQLLRATSINVA